MAPPTDPTQRLTKRQLFRAAITSREWTGPASYAILFQIIHSALALAQLMLALYMFHSLLSYARWSLPCYKYHSKAAAHTEPMRPPLTLYYVDEETLKPKGGGGFGRGLPLPALICFNILLPTSTLVFSLNLIVKSIWRRMPPRLLDGMAAGWVQGLLLATTFAGVVWMPVDYEKKRAGKLPICFTAGAQRGKVERARGERVNTLFAWEMVMWGEVGMILIYLTLTLITILLKMKANKSADIELVARRRVDALLAETTPQRNQAVASPTAAIVSDAQSKDRDLEAQVEEASEDIEEAVNTPLPVASQQLEEEEFDIGNGKRGAGSVSGGSDGDWCEVGDVYVEVEVEGQRSKV